MLKWLLGCLLINVGMVTASEELCQSTGGTWDPLACGHYDCGYPQECAAVIPGCDCGFNANFVEEVGCVVDPECDTLRQAVCESTGGAWDPLACGHYDCGYPQECAAIIPGCDCGFDANFVEGLGCTPDPECDDLRQALCESTGGTWDPLACGHYNCGIPNACEAIIPGCNCGPADNYVEGSGCLADVACNNAMVIVELDMDLQSPGVQHAVTIDPCNDVVDVAVYVSAPTEGYTLWGIGYFGGLDRGIAFGHMPADNHGGVTAIAATPGEPVNPTNTAVVSPFIMQTFFGPEIHYLETGAEAPSEIPVEPDAPLFTAHITLQDIAPGDAYSFYLLDAVSVWTDGAHGAFSVVDPSSLDTGGDALADNTLTMYGTDPDTPINVPPASYYVDYIDGGAAMILVTTAYADLDASGSIDAADLAMLVGSWGPCPDCPGDLNHDDVINAADLAALLGAWGTCD